MGFFERSDPTGSDRSKCWGGGHVFACRITDQGCKMPRLPSAARLALSLLALVPLSTALDQWSSRGGSTVPDVLSKPLPTTVHKKQPPRPRRTFSASEFVFVDPKPAPQRGLSSLFNPRAPSKKEAKFLQKLAIIAQAGAGTALIVAFERSIWAIGWYSGVKIPSAPVCPATRTPNWTCRVCCQRSICSRVLRPPSRRVQRDRYRFPH